MLIGGMFDIDVEHALSEPENKSFVLECDHKGVYNRKFFTNNGRTATVLALNNGIKIKHSDVILIPEYNCISIINALSAAGADYQFYKVKEGLIIDTDDIRNKMSDSVVALYVIPYFGVPQPKRIVDELIKISKDYNVPIIEDLTQALFTVESGTIGFGDLIVSSTRKWFPMTDGGIVFVKDGMNFKTPELKEEYDEAVYTQMFLAAARYYYGAKDVLDDDAYLNIERTANSKRYLDFTPKAMTHISSNIFFQTDLKRLKSKRRENYTTLYELLKDDENVQIVGTSIVERPGIVPFGIQLIVNERDKLAAYLRYHKVIPEIQWVLPTQYYVPSEYALYMSEHSLMLQCDQRYGREEMEYTVKIIRQFFAESGDGCVRKDCR